MSKQKTKRRDPMRLQKRIAAVVAVVLCLSLVLSSASAQLGDASVSALDVGQGQSVLLRSGQFLTLVDCGGDSADNPGDLAADYIQSQGWDRLDLLVVSHFHDDHANGVPQLLRRLEVDKLGLDNIDRRMLTAIIQNYGGGPVGLETLAATIGEEAVTLEDVYEPYLMQLGFLTRTPRGRCVTALAYDHLHIPYEGQSQFSI